MKKSSEKTPPRKPSSKSDAEGCKCTCVCPPEYKASNLASAQAANAAMG